MNLTGAMLAGLRLLTTIRRLEPVSSASVSSAWRAPEKPPPHEKLPGQESNLRR
jgi:hypothetical protein